MNIDFSPEKNLFSLPVIRWGGGSIFIIAFISALIIAFHSRNLPFELSPDGFENFAKNFKVPATFLAIMAAFIGLCAANHRSEQSKAQIKLTSEQNIFSNHYKHLEEFESFIKIIHEKRQTILKKDIEPHKTENKFNSLVNSELLGPHIDADQYRSLYRMIYPKSNSGNFEPSIEYKNKLNEFTKFILHIYPAIYSNDENLVKDGIIIAHKKTKKFKRQNFLIIEHDTYETARLKNETFSVPHGDFKYIFIEAFCAIELINRVLDFDFNHQTNDEFEKIKFLNNSDAISNIKINKYNEKSFLFTDSD